MKAFGRHGSGLKISILRDNNAAPKDRGRAVGDALIRANGPENDRTAAARAGRFDDHPALAAFVKRPQAELQIGAGH